MVIQYNQNTSFHVILKWWTNSKSEMQLLEEKQTVALRFNLENYLVFRSDF